jgi:transcriptional regulator with XRE-family HTH domain
MKKETEKEQDESNRIIDQFMASIPPLLKRTVDKKMEIAVQIHEALLAKGWSQKDLAQKTGKRESEVSRWLSGRQNLTVETLCMIEEALGQDVIQVPMFVQSKADYFDHIAALGIAQSIRKMPTRQPAVSPYAVPRPNGISIQQLSLQPMSSHEYHA